MQRSTRFGREGFRALLCLSHDETYCPKGGSGMSQAAMGPDLVASFRFLAVRSRVRMRATAI